MAKDFRSRSVELAQAYGSLKSFLTGPCKHNQLHMAMETECVLVVNRVLRELYKDADKHYRKREEKVKKKKTPGYMQTTATANNKKVAGDESKSPSAVKKPKK